EACSASGQWAANSWLARRHRPRERVLGIAWHCDNRYCTGWGAEGAIACDGSPLNSSSIGTEVNRGASGLLGYAAAPAGKRASGFGSHPGRWLRRTTWRGIARMLRPTLASRRRGQPWPQVASSREDDLDTAPLDLGRGGQPKGDLQGKAADGTPPP